jgi:hypothetical protein
MTPRYNGRPESKETTDGRVSSRSKTTVGDAACFMTNDAHDTRGTVLMKRRP